MIGVLIDLHMARCHLKLFVNTLSLSCLKEAIIHMKTTVLGILCGYIPVLISDCQGS